MSNKTQLQANNLRLNTFINRINIAKDIAASLPEAGADVEFWDGSFSGDLEPLGYTLRFYNTLTNEGLVMYSIDEGSSWVDLYGILELSGIEQIMFRCSKTSSGSIVAYGILESNKLDLILSGMPGGITESLNLILTEDVSDIAIYQDIGNFGGQ